MGHVHFPMVSQKRHVVPFLEEAMIKAWPDIGMDKINDLSQYVFSILQTCWNAFKNSSKAIFTKRISKKKSKKIATFYLRIEKESKNIRIHFRSICRGIKNAY